MSVSAETVNRLLLFAQAGPLNIERSDELVPGLSGVGLIGERMHPGSADYDTGSRFIDLVTFLGCSPSIALSAEDGPGHCFVRVHELTAAPRLFSGKNTRAPGCSRCRQSREDWQQCASVNYCEKCTAEDRQQILNWRRQGAFSRLGVSLMNVYPHEAVPTSQLLTMLEDVSGVQWRYAYLQSD